MLKLIGIYVSYKLSPGLGGKVTSVTTSPDGTTLTADAEYRATAASGWFSIAYMDGFAVGDYNEVLTFEPTGESVTLLFTITEPAPTPSTSP